jgi:hypothetical protein
VPGERERRDVLLECRGETHRVVPAPVDGASPLPNQERDTLVSELAQLGETHAQVDESLVDPPAFAPVRLLVWPIAEGRDREKPVAEKLVRADVADALVDVGTDLGRELHVEVMHIDVVPGLRQDRLEQATLDRGPARAREGHVHQRQPTPATSTGFSLGRRARGAQRQARPAHVLHRRDLPVRRSHRTRET